MTAVYPGAQNTYVPELTDQLTVDYSRNVAKFAVNSYVQIVRPDKQSGKFLKMSREEAGRIEYSDLRNFFWPDGDDRPAHNNELESFDFIDYRTQRINFGYNVGYLSSQQAQWNLRQKMAGIKAEQAMRGRTQLVVNALTTSGNYLSTHTSAVASITNASGTLDQSTTARKDIKRAFDYGADQIYGDTLNGVEPGDLKIVMSRGAARKLSLAQEFIDYIKGSPAAIAEMQGELPNRNAFFGLPKKLYGYEIVIEDTQKVTSRKGASSVANSQILADNNVVMLSRQGGLVSDIAPAWSTAVLFMKEEMTVQEKDDDWNRKVHGSVTEDYQAQVVSNIAGFLYTSSFSY